MLLQHLKVIFLVGGVLVDDEDVGVEFGDDESQVELTDDLHVFEHLLTGRDERTKHLLLYKYRNKSGQLIAGYVEVRPYLISFFSSSSALWFSPGFILALKRR